MRIRFWGTRGSLAKPGVTTFRYGGNTSCVEVRARDGTLIVLDCGTGAHGLGQTLLASGERPLRGHLLITHTHWDHIQGFPFFAPLFLADSAWDIYAPLGLGQRLQETLAGQMQYTYFPVSLDRLGATIRYHDLVEGRFTLGDVRVTTQYLNHPALTLGYRLEAAGVTVVYATDHEPHSRLAPVTERAGKAEATAACSAGDRRHAEFLAQADLLIHDCQYDAAEYPAKIRWGHSPMEYVVETAMSARVKRLALFHHDPLREDASVDRLVEAARGRVAGTGNALDVFAAAEGQVIELASRAPAGTAQPGAGADALELAGAPRALVSRAVVVALGDPPTATLIADALRLDGIPVLPITDGESALRLVASERPGLVILDRHLRPLDGLAVCRTLRNHEERGICDLPVVLVVAAEDPDDAVKGAAAGVTDWLVEPFSPAYVRTKVRAWLLRTRTRWMRAPLPPDERQRLAALRRLNVLDTAPEERFDRLARLAQRLFEVPIALVSFVDENRQWVKSCQGLEMRETGRENAFCAHAILGPSSMVVPDALEDLRFAENPLATEPSHGRFSAGHPLRALNGSGVGTPCIIDHRPGPLGSADLRALRDLAGLGERALAGGRLP